MSKPILHVMLSKEVQKNWKAAQHVSDAIKRVFREKYDILFSPKDWETDKPIVEVIPDNSTVVNLNVDSSTDLNKLAYMLDKIVYDPDLFIGQVGHHKEEVYDHSIEFSSLEVSSSINDTHVNAKVGVSDVEEEGEQPITVFSIDNLTKSRNENLRAPGIQSMVHGFCGVNGFTITLHGYEELKVMARSLQFIVDELNKEIYPISDEIEFNSIIDNSNIEEEKDAISDN